MFPWRKTLPGRSSLSCSRSSRSCRKSDSRVRTSGISLSKSSSGRGGGEVSLGSRVDSRTGTDQPGPPAGGPFDPQPRKEQNEAAPRTRQTEDFSVRLPTFGSIPRRTPRPLTPGSLSIDWFGLGGY